MIADRSPESIIAQLEKNVKEAKALDQELAEMDARVEAIEKRVSELTKENAVLTTWYVFMARMGKQ